MVLDGDDDGNVDNVILINIKIDMIILRTIKQQNFTEFINSFQLS